MAPADSLGVVTQRQPRASVKERGIDDRFPDHLVTREQQMCPWGRVPRPVERDQGSTLMPRGDALAQGR